MQFRPLLVLLILAGTAVSFGSWMWNYNGNKTERALARAQSTVVALSTVAAAPLPAIAPSLGPESNMLQSAEIVSGTELISDTTGAFRSAPVVDVMPTVTPTPGMSIQAADNEGGYTQSGVPVPVVSDSVVESFPVVLPSGWSVVSLFTIESISEGVSRVCVDVAYN